ncbi:hypothetical protein C5167_043792 [Papaver somniferum]|uniref:Uncharacterized protein n=1 Tax=Papaver somniferum TaxID=3469 RepID=A0A4Y7L7Q1_PAPSO|nr:hypothetical protein C5167_043792 [Papaver somniferum]
MVSWVGAGIQEFVWQVRIKDMESKFIVAMGLGHLPGDKKQLELQCLGWFRVKFSKKVTSWSSTRLHHSLASYES